MMHTLESVFRELRLHRIPHLINSVERSSREEWLVNLLVHEVEAKEQRRIDRLIKQAKFTSIRTLEGFEWQDQIRVQDTQKKEQLISLDFIQSNQNVVCIGTLSTGKKHLASALGYRACQEGIDTWFWPVSNLVIGMKKVLLLHQTLILEAGTKYLSIRASHRRWLIGSFTMYIYSLLWVRVTD